MRTGICVAGNALVDKLMVVGEYPAEGRLASVRGDMRATTGGALCNVAVDLVRLDPSLAVQTIGAVGQDEDGAMIRRELEQYENIDLSLLRERGVTSCTYVMTSAKTKQRTFFYYGGANKTLCIDDFPFERINAKILHIGYILILDALDAEDDEYTTKMARLLSMARKNGIETSIDVTSDMGDRFKRLVPPALQYTCYCVINETEAQEVTGIRLRDAKGTLLTENMPRTLEHLFGFGVEKWAVIHAPEGGFGMDNNGNYVKVNSLRLPENFIKGTVGAGDAFCAGVLLGAYHGKSLEISTLQGVCAAASSLSHETASRGVCRIDQALALAR